MGIRCQFVACRAGAAVGGVGVAAGVGTQMCALLTLIHVWSGTEHGVGRVSKDDGFSAQMCMYKLLMCTYILSLRCLKLYIYKVFVYIRGRFFVTLHVLALNTCRQWIHVALSFLSFSF